MLSHKITMITFQEAMNRMGKMIRNMMVGDTSADMTIVMEDLEAESNLMEIRITYHGNQFSVSRSIRKDIDTHTIRIKIRLA